MSVLRGKWGLLLAAALAAAVVCVPVFAQQEGPRPESGLIDMSEAERAWLAEHEHLRLGLWLESPPIIFRGDDGTLQGLIPAYVDMIDEKLGLKPKRVRASSLSAMMELARAREVDVVSAMIPDSDPGGNMVPSEPYLFMPIVVVTRSDFRFISGLADLEGLVVAMERAHVPHQKIPVDYPGIHPLVVDGPASGLKAVVAGEAAAYVGAQPTIAYLSQRLGLDELRISAITEYSYSLSVGVRRDWPVLLTLVNRALASVSEDERKSISDYWTVLRAGQWMERPKVWRLIGGVSAAAGGLVLLFIFWNRRLAREVRRRRLVEQELRKAHEATRKVIESADVIIIGLDYTGHVRLLNAAGERATGYSREELLGKDWFDSVVPRERFPFVWDEFSRLAQQGASPSSDSFENPILTKSGGVRHIQWRNSCLGMEHGVEDVFLISFGTDITNRLKAEEELQADPVRHGQRIHGRAPGAALRAHRLRQPDRGDHARPDPEQRAADDPAGRDLGRGPARSGPCSGSGSRSSRSPPSSPSIRTEDGGEMSGGGARLLPAVQGHGAGHLLFRGHLGAQAGGAAARGRGAHGPPRPALADPGRADPAPLPGQGGQPHRAAAGAHGDGQGLQPAHAGHHRPVPDPVHHGGGDLPGGVAEPVDLLPLADAVASELAPLMRARKVRMVVNVSGEPVSSNSVFMVRSEELPCYALLANLLKNAVEASPEGGTVTLDLRLFGRPRGQRAQRGRHPRGQSATISSRKYVTVGKMRGTGLGTYTARLIATSLGGDIAFTTSAGAGTTLTVTLPL